MPRRTNNDALRASTLRGVVASLRRGDLLVTAEVDEIKRLLQVLQDNGWSGFIPADEALKAIVDAQRRYQKALEEIVLGGARITEVIRMASRALEEE